jgi:hypothetical protein
MVNGRGWYFPNTKMDRAYVDSQLFRVCTDENSSDVGTVMERSERCIL